MLINAARTGARLGGKFRSHAGKLASDIDPPRCRDPARPAQSGTPVGSSSEPADPTRKDRSRAIDSCMLLRTLRAGSMRSRASHDGVRCHSATCRDPQPAESFCGELRVASSEKARAEGCAGVYGPVYRM
jgi:hypothetical protein